MILTSQKDQIDSTANGKVEDGQRCATFEETILKEIYPQDWKGFPVSRKQPFLLSS